MLLRSPFRRLQDLMAAPPREVGDITTVAGGLATVALIGGGTVNVRGENASVGQRVFIRGDVIEGAAPALTLVTVEV